MFASRRSARRRGRRVRAGILRLEGAHISSFFLSGVRLRDFEGCDLFGGRVVVARLSGRVVWWGVWEGFMFLSFFLSVFVLIEAGF